MSHRRKMRVKPDPDWSPKKDDFVTKTSSRFRWRIENYSRLNSYLAQGYYSDVFKFGSYKWRLLLYPKGKDSNNHISIFLENAGSLGFSSNTWYTSPDATLGSSIGSCSDKIGSFSGTTTVSIGMRSSYSHGSPIGSSCGLASANLGSPFSLASTSSSPSRSLALASANLGSPFSFATTSSTPSCSLASTGSSPSYSSASVNLGSYFSFPLPNLGYSFPLSSHNTLQNMEYSLSVLDQIHNKYTVRKEGQHEINGQNRIGFTSFMPLSRLNDPGRGYLANDTCIIEAEIGFPGFLVNSPQRTVADKSMETEPQVLSCMQVISDMDPVAMSMPEPETKTELGRQKNEHLGEEKAHFELGVEDQVTKTETLLKFEVATEFNTTMAKCEAPTSIHLSNTPMLEYNLAGQLFEDGRHRQGTVFNEKLEDVGGFSVLKTQVPLYKQIWLKYGHIASSQVLMDSYSAQVSVVTDIMNSVLDMNQQRVSELSSEMIEAWEKKIKMAEKLEFNISWLRKRFELVKEDFYGEHKLQAALVEHDQAKARLVAAEEQLTLANNEMKNARENLSVLETKLTPLLFQQKMYQENGTRLVLDGLLQ